jgi:hypothetical protein
MGKILLWISGVLLAVYVVKSQFLSSSTYQPFITGCLASGSASEEQCTCLSSYLHKLYSDNEMKMIMAEQYPSASFKAKFESDLSRGSQACR